jgi:polyphenol oxidase
VTEALPFPDRINSLPGVRAGWVPRLSGIDVEADRDEAMRRLKAAHFQAVVAFGGSEDRWWRAEQVHGTSVAVVPGASTILAPDGLPVVPGVDGLVTNTPGIVLAIYVADCGPIWLADPKSGAVGLLHSGKKGTEGNILQTGLDAMCREFGSKASDVVVALGPCIRPPHYEIDFAAEIGRQAERAGVADYVDCAEDTALDLERHYSYRIEQGKTGRMMALISKLP